MKKKRGGGRSILFYFFLACCHIFYIFSSKDNSIFLRSIPVTNDSVRNKKAQMYFIPCVNPNRALWLIVLRSNAIENSQLADNPSGISTWQTLSVTELSVPGSISMTSREQKMDACEATKVEISRRSRTTCEIRITGLRSWTETASDVRL